MLSDIRILFQSDVYRVVRYQCYCDICSISNAEYNDSFNISFIRTGFFGYRTFRKEDEAHTGRILISKPGYEHTTRHIDKQPDITTTIEFNAGFLPEIVRHYKKEAGWLLQNRDLHALAIHSDAALDHWHHLFLRTVQPAGQNTVWGPATADKLQVDEQVMQMLEKVMHRLGSIVAVPPVPDNIKQYHLPTIEQAQGYLLEHFREDISLQQVAEYCHVSPFHFSRLFKTILRVSPHQYLLGIRLQQAKLLLDDTAKPVSDIAFDCGFNSPEHFATAYRKRYGVSPSEYRRLVG